MINHASASVQNVTTLEEVLCHEIGHALGLAHSSENPSEPDPALSEAMMYYRTHADGRGAALGAWDPPVVQLLHPVSDTPPYTFSRVMDIVTSSSPPTTRLSDRCRPTGRWWASRVIRLRAFRPAGPTRPRLWVRAAPNRPGGRPSVRFR